MGKKKPQMTQMDADERERKKPQIAQIHTDGEGRKWPRMNAEGRGQEGK